MQNRYAIEVKHLLNTVLTSPGAIDTTMRESIEVFFAAEGDRIYVPVGEIPATLQACLEKVVRHACKVTDEELQDLSQDTPKKRFLRSPSLRRLKPARAGWSGD